MLIIPAIDLKDGCVVRYTQGKIDKKVYSRDPVKVAKHWVKQGAKMLHLVDLDGAFTGTLKNLAIVKDIVRSITIPVEFGGGIRQIKVIKELLSSGIRRIILGTKAAEDKKFLRKVFAEFGERIIVGIDVRGQNVMVKGWRSASSGFDCLEFAGFLKELGFREIVYTDTLRDGTLSGPNIKGIKDFLKKTGLNIIASGGISVLEDIYKLKKLEKLGIKGVIIGKALYEGRFTLSEAVKIS